ncbi:MAG: EAL domain-containing protein [Angelakisella sp.]
MQTLSIFYSSKVAFLNFLQQGKLDSQGEYLVRIYPTACDRQQAVTIAEEIRSALPNAAIIGATGSGVIRNGKQSENDTLVVVEQFEHTKVLVAAYTFANRTAAELAAELAASIAQQPVKLMHLLCGDRYYDANDLVAQLNQRCPGLRLAGGVAGDILSANLNGFVFTKNGVVEQGIVTAALCSDTLMVHSEVNTAHEPISPVYTINKMEEGWILEIENRPAINWCCDQFGLDALQEYTDWQQMANNDVLVRFPLMLEGHSGASRFVRYDSKKGLLALHHSRLPDNTAFRIGYTSPTKCVKECFDLCNRLAKVPVESMFCYSCLLRKLYLENCAEWELRPFQQYNICGVFMMGEIGYVNGQNELFHGCCSIIGIAEEQRYIAPDYSAFEDMYRVRDDSEQLHSFVLQRQSAAMSRENQQLLEKLLQQQEKAKEQLYTDPNTGLFNTIKFAEDNQQLQFNKMCMVQVENANLLLSSVGQRRYWHLLRCGVIEVRRYMNTVEQGEQYHPYMVNDNTFFFATGPEVSELSFMRVARALYDRFQFFKLGDKDDLIINRFVMVVNQKNMLEMGLMALHNSRNLQTHFIICDNTPTSGQNVNQEIKMLRILNQVIEHGWLEPYFQGIHNNKTGKIDRYESLMRIYDENGTIYPPAAFMDIAKRYHLYSALSHMMLDKVLTLIGNTTTEISVNLSVHDITYEPMRNFIFERLDELGYTDNLIFEILEDENFHDMDALHAFIQRARQYGVRVAVDDFGSGYSSFMEIARMEPEFIKIDSSIIKGINGSAISRKVLTNIVFLGRQLNAQLVAEYVENLETQMNLASLDIDFSQGYYFAKPQPYGELAAKMLPKPKIHN